MRSDYFLEEFKKVKRPTFYGEMKKSEDAKVWFLGMKKLFILHSYSKNMKSNIATFSLKWKEDIWWEDVKNVKGIWEDDLILDELERLFKKKYLSERYYDEIAKDFYNLQMGSMTDYQCTSKFLELLRYVPYIKEEKAKIHRFISGLLVAYRDQIEFDELRSLEEAIRMLKHCYEQSKHKAEPKHGFKGNEKFKGKWPPKWGRHQDVDEKENVVPYKKFNAV